MANPIMNALRFIVAVAFGIGLAYFWMTTRNEADYVLLGGIGVVTTVITYTLLYMFGKGGGS